MYWCDHNRTLGAVLFRYSDGGMKKTMVLVGLTGGIASGKSTVADLLAQKGALVFDADHIARKVMEPGCPAWYEISGWLGQEYLRPDLSLDRVRIGKLIFHDAAARAKLNRIIHPRVREELLIRTAQVRRDLPAGRVVVYDVPLLIEAEMHCLVEVVLLVYVPRAVQIERLIRRDGLSRAEAVARLATQMPLDKKKQYAHHVIDNSGALTETTRQVNLIWGKLARGEKGEDG